MTHRSFVGPLALLACLLAVSTAGAQTVYDPGITPPELVGKTWLNLPMPAPEAGDKGDKSDKAKATAPDPIKLADRKGKVTIVEFWTFG